MRGKDFGERGICVLKENRKNDFRESKKNVTEIKKIESERMIWEKERGKGRNRVMRENMTF